jgi:hypothetical protein
MKSIFFLIGVSFIMSNANAHGNSGDGGCPSGFEFESSNYDCNIHFWDGVGEPQQKNYEFKDILRGQHSDWKKAQYRNEKVVYTTAKGTEVFLGANMACSYYKDPDKDFIDIYIDKGETQMLEGIYVRHSSEFRYVFEIDRNPAIISCKRKKNLD